MTTRKMHASEQRLGHYQRHRTRRGTVLRFHRAHRLADEMAGYLAERRLPVRQARRYFGLERGEWRDVWELAGSFIVVLLLVVALGAWWVIAWAAQTPPPVAP